MDLEPKTYLRDEHNISRTDLDSDALKIMYRLIRHGYKAYLVGGGVRDLLLNKKPKDFDISTDATPKQIRSLFGNCRIIGRRFKLAHIFFQGGKIIEVSTFRDVTDPIDPQDAAEMDQVVAQRIQDNRFGTAETDAIRRDITINGLFYDPASFSVIDYVGGVPDLRQGIVRMIGDPEIRIAEDPVRIIRAIRHAARAGFSVEPSLRKAIHNNASLLQSCSSMRVFEELKKDLCSGYCFEILGLLSEFSVLEQLWPELDQFSSDLRSRQRALGRSLNRLDAVVLAGKPVSSTAVLSVICLLIIAPELFNSLSFDQLDRQQVEEGTAACFTKLAVPRKERQRIEDTLSMWIRLNASNTKVKLASLSRHEQLSDIVTLAEVFETERYNSELFEMIREAKKSQPNHQRGRSAQGRGRGSFRGPRRGPARSSQRTRG